MIFKTKWIFAFTSLLVLAWSPAVAQDRGETEGHKKFKTIKEVMKLAHKKGLTKKVATGKAAADEKKRLLDMYQALTKLDPPKGDKESWKKRTAQLVAAAKAAVEGTDGYARKLLKATNCTSCHKVHK